MSNVQCVQENFPARHRCSSICWPSMVLTKQYRRTRNSTPAYTIAPAAGTAAAAAVAPRVHSLLTRRYAALCVALHLQIAQHMLHILQNLNQLYSRLPTSVLSANECLATNARCVNMEIFAWSKQKCQTGKR